MYSQEQIIQNLRQEFGAELTSRHLYMYSNTSGISYVTLTKKLAEFKVGRGSWNLSLEETQEQLEETYNAPAAMPKTEVDLIPEVDHNYVPFGNFNDVKKIIKSGIFYPVFITGLSGNGKTQSVEQACAQLNREIVRVNLTIESDEDSLTGGYRLENGSTVWFNGPVVDAMQRGAILLLDEIDLASPAKIMCLQSIMEGNGYYIKKIRKHIKPAPGFNIVATANTRLQGDLTGAFIATNVMNSAFIDRFSITFEWNYPTPATEKKIVLNYMKKLNCVDEDYATKLITWAETIRKTYNDGGVDSVITTRKLIHIVQAYAIFEDRMKAVELTMNIFDQDTRESFVDLYAKVDADVNQNNYSENISE